MSLEKRILASGLFENEVVDNDGKEIGKLVNIIFDRRFFDARMLIFPNVEKWIGELVGSFGDASKEAINELASPLSKEINEFIKKLSKRGVDQGTKKLKAYLGGGMPEEQLKKMYFLITSREIGGLNKKRITLKNSRKYYWERYKRMRTFVENDLAFNDADSILGLSNLEPVNLNLVSIKGMAVKDSAGKWGRIMNLQLDIQEGRVGNVIIETTGKGAGERLVNSEKIDFGSFDCESIFEECSSLP